MIIGLGIDSIEIDRFKKWYLYAPTTLARIFSQQEIKYCLNSPIKSAERFAARFAAREAFYKALSGIDQKTKLPFVKVCKNIHIEKAYNGYPKMNINWHAFLQKDQKASTFIVHLSLTHNKSTATAIVILESQASGNI